MKLGSLCVRGHHKMHAGNSSQVITCQLDIERHATKTDEKGNTAGVTCAVLLYVVDAVV